MHELPARSAHTDSSSSLEDLLELAASGSETAFAELYDRTASAVFGMAFRTVQVRSQAAEVTQEVYLQLWRTAGRFDRNRSAVLPWLLMIAHRRAVDWVRSTQACRERDSRWATSNQERDFDNASEAAEARGQASVLQRALDSLSAVQRQAVCMAFLSEMTHSEIAAHIDVPLGTAKTRIRAGLTNLRSELSMA